MTLRKQVRGTLTGAFDFAFGFEHREPETEG